MLDKSTSWGKVANWYDNLLDKGARTYQKNLILPSLLRILEIKSEKGARAEAEDKTRKEIPLNKVFTFSK